MLVGDQAVTATIGAVIHRRYPLRNWWGNAPYRRCWFWRELLFAPGDGWLRWGMFETPVINPPDFDVTFHAPPLRRLWMALNLRYWSAWEQFANPERRRFLDLP